jgi:NAD(P)-dependent dehydrogenase (short-subunit alcohol dehydrogenase family)
MAFEQQPGGAIGERPLPVAAKLARSANLNLSSTCGHEGAAGASVYVGSKHAVEGITKSVALEIAKSGIRVNGVAPGPTDTAMLSRSFTRMAVSCGNSCSMPRRAGRARHGASPSRANGLTGEAGGGAGAST